MLTKHKNFKLLVLVMLIISLMPFKIFAHSGHGADSISMIYHMSAYHAYSIYAGLIVALVIGLIICAMLKK